MSNENELNPAHASAPVNVRLYPHWYDLDAFTRQYIETAIWASTREDGTDCPPPMDDSHGTSDLSDDALRQMVHECALFQEHNEDSITKYDDSQCGHDFWLTRNGHGAGFWDGDYSEPEASTLTKASEQWGEQNLYIGDDSKIYIG